MKFQPQRQCPEAFLCHSLRHEMDDLDLGWDMSHVVAAGLEDDDVTAGYEVDRSRDEPVDPLDVYGLPDQRSKRIHWIRLRDRKARSV